MNNYTSGQRPGPRRLNAWARVALTTATVAALLLSGMAVASVTPGNRAGGSTGVVKVQQTEHVRSRCDDLWLHAQEMRHPRRVKERCRREGWTIKWWANISPHGYRFWTGTQPCRYDEIRPGEWCHWNARTMGNGRGQSFVHLGHLGVFYGMHRINGERA